MVAGTPGKSISTLLYMSSSIGRKRILGFRHALQVKTIENYLALGWVQEAVREFYLLPRYARQHPDAVHVLELIQAFPEPTPTR